jgi:hypothetical protein
MNLNSLMPLLGSLQSALPILSTLGVPGIGMVNAGLELAKALKERVEQGQLILQANEAADLDAVIEKLEAEAAEANQRVLDS